MRDDVTLQRRFPLAGRIQKRIPDNPYDLLIHVTTVDADSLIAYMHGVLSL